MLCHRTTSAGAALASIGIVLSVCENSVPTRGSDALQNKHILPETKTWAKMITESVHVSFIDHFATSTT
jgi:hypothetical protein